MLNTDLALKEAAATARSQSQTTASSNEAAFHFIAFMPVADQLWKLDGLERQPLCLGQLSITLFGAY